MSGVGDVVSVVLADARRTDRLLQSVLELEQRVDPDESTTKRTITACSDMSLLPAEFLRGVPTQIDCASLVSKMPLADGGARRPRSIGQVAPAEHVRHHLERGGAGNGLSDGASGRYG